jgi:hypothetical protein
MLLSKRFTGAAAGVVCGLLLISGLTTGSAEAAAPTPNSPLAYWDEFPGGGWNLNPNTSQLSSPGMTVSPTGLGHNTPESAVHAFTVDSAGNLWDSFASSPFSSPASWTRTNLTSLTGATVSTATSVGALYLGGSLPSTQVFALSPAGHLLSFTTTLDGGNWQVFDLSTISGSGARLTTASHPIQFGSTVHVYATDNNKHLHDFYKPSSTNWQDIDLTNQTGAHAIFGVPYAYGGNSIQTVSTTASGDLETFVQVVFSDGTINSSVRPAAFDITRLSGGTELPFGTSSPVVTGDNTVNIFVDDTHSNLVDFTKTPTGQWQVSVIAFLGQRNLTPSAFWDGPLGTLHVLTNNSSGQLTDYVSTSSGPPFNPVTLPGAGGAAFGDPSLVGVANGQFGPTLVAFSNY